MSNTKVNQQSSKENLIRYGELEDELGGSIRTAERRLGQAIHANRLKQKELQRFDKEYSDLDKLLEDLPKKLSHKIMVPLSTVAFMPGEIYNTNKVKVLLGENYFVKCSTSHAQTILHRRQEYIKESMDHIEKQFKELQKRAGLTSELLDVSQAEDLVEIREDYNSDEEEEDSTTPLKPAPGAQKTKPKIEVISSKPAKEESDEEDENMRMINEYLRREEGDEDEDDEDDDMSDDEEYFEQDPGPGVNDIQTKMAKQSLDSAKSKPTSSAVDKQPLKSAMKSLKPVADSDPDLPPLMSISAKSGNVVDQLPTIKSSANKSAPTPGASKSAKKGVSFSDPTPVKPITEKKPVLDDEEDDRFVVKMANPVNTKPASNSDEPPKRVSKFKQQMSK